MRVVVIGGGAAGIFSAISCATNNSEAEVTLLEKGFKLLSKVKISGGGRCNVTNACFENYELVKHYPRGSAELKKIFNHFSVKDTISFFEIRGLPLKIEKDNRIFPQTDDSQSIIDCLIKEARVLGVKIMTEFAVKMLNPNGNSFSLSLRSGERVEYDRVIVATGGNPNEDSYGWLKDLGHDIIKPVPSLFTFNVPNSRFNGLQGISVKDCIIKIQGGQEERGPLLITHWGFSGPAILKLSAWSARQLYEMQYHFTIYINFVPDFGEENLREHLFQYKNDNIKKNVSSNPLFGLAKRLWERICHLVGIGDEEKWGELSKKHINKLIEELLRSSFIVKGKTTFKDEFVTCGGVDLKNINLHTMESIKCQGLFFAGEVLDIDGITGGFNFQAAWSTGWLAGKSAAQPEINITDHKK